MTMDLPPDNLIIPGQPQATTRIPTPELARLASLLGVPHTQPYCMEDLVQLALQTQTDRLNENMLSIRLVKLVQQAMTQEHGCSYCNAQYGHSPVCEASLLFEPLAQAERDAHPNVVVDDPTPINGEDHED